MYKGTADLRGRISNTADAAGFSEVHLRSVLYQKKLIFRSSVSP